MGELIITGDGSHTIFVSELNEHYHSTYGAVKESQHIFINQGFNALSPTLSQINILEIGFGTGLNALLTLMESEKQKKNVLYHSVEAFPLQESIWSELNYESQAGSEVIAGSMRKLHESEWETETQISTHFKLKKIQKDLKEFQPRFSFYHVVYFDAFGPDVQPELWSQEIFARLHKSLLPGGLLVTYSVKGEVKRALKHVGFKIEKLPGPIGKREILRGRI